MTRPKLLTTAPRFAQVFDGLQDVLPIVENVPAGMETQIDMEPYTKTNFKADLMRVTGNRADPILGDILIDESNQTIKWLSKHVGIRFQLSFNRQAYEVDGRFKFWGGMVLTVVNGGKGLVEQHALHSAKVGIETRFNTPVVGLVQEKDEVVGVSVGHPDGSTSTIFAKGGVILCAGGFESNAR